MGEGAESKNVQSFVTVTIYQCRYFCHSSNLIGNNMAIDTFSNRTDSVPHAPHVLWSEDRAIASDRQNIVRMWHRVSIS